MTNQPIRRNRLPMFIRKKMWNGGLPDDIQGGTDPNTWQSQSTPIVGNPSPSEKMYQIEQGNQYPNTPSFAYNGQPNHTREQQPLGLPSLMDSMYVANVGLRGISEMAARGKQQDYIQANTANPLANLAFDDGQSDRVKYGYEQFAEGGLYDYLSSTGRNNAKGYGDTRKALAASLGFKDYKGTAEQNTALLSLLKEADQKGVSPFTIQNPVRRHAEYRQEESPKQVVAPQQQVQQQGPTGIDNIIPKSDLSFLRKKDMSFLNNSPSIRDIYNETNKGNVIKVPDSGVVVDKRTGQAYIINGGKSVKQFPVLTGADVESNVNTVSSLDSDNLKSGKSTPVGFYQMHGKDKLSDLDLLEFDGNVQRMSAIDGPGMKAPLATKLGIHQTYDPENRDKLFNTSTPYASFGCINCHKPDIKDINQRFPQGDTLMVVDSKDPKFYDVMKGLKKQKKGGKIRGLNY